MNRSENEDDPYLQQCPHCGAWPMAFVDQVGGAWARVPRLRFMCASCRTEVVRSKPLGPLVRSSTA